MCILYSKSNGFCIISLNIIKHSLVFHTFLPWLASGAPLGPWAPSWRPLLDLSGRIFRLGSSLGSSLGASVFFLVCFFCFSTSHGIIFSKFQAYLWFDIEMYNQIHTCVFHFTFYVAVCVLIRNLTGRISRRWYLHVIGRETGNGYSRHFVELKIPPPKGGRHMVTWESLHTACLARRRGSEVIVVVVRDRTPKL